MARALPADGKLTTLEYDPDHAEVAWDNIERAGLADRVDLRVGAALETLPLLESEGAGPSTSSSSTPTRSTPPPTSPGRSTTPAPAA